ncbi:MAG: thiamine pyrophosphate-dependent enzyme [Syntrophobacteraceae bacterium]
MTVTYSMLLELYRSMLSARIIDELEGGFTRTGEAVFHVSGAGHESTAALAVHLRPFDWLHCHYRDKALMLARGLAPEMFFLSLFCKDSSHSRGRQMSAHISCPELNLLSLVGPVGNNALQAVGVASAVADAEGRPMVVCGLGEGTTQQGEVLEAIGEAARDACPVLFLVQDNGLAISTRTAGRTFHDLGGRRADAFYGVDITHCNGSDVVECHDVFGRLVETIRRSRKPQICVVHVPRLSDHTNADRQEVYRSAEEMREAQALDPIPRLEAFLLREGLSESGLTRLREEIRLPIQAAVDSARNAPDPEPCFVAKAELPERLTASHVEEPRYDCADGLAMGEAIREVLRRHLRKDSRVTLFGEDIEDPKGDVFGVTRGLSTQFPGQVRNSPLSESTIVGKSIGQALAGGRPVAFLQFADFLPLAFNQIVSELGSLHWRTDGGWQAPVIVMVTCGGYRPGLGPFHAQSFEAIVSHAPGIDVMLPSNAVDAAGLLNAAFESNRPTLFFYPKSLLNERTVTLPSDKTDLLVPIGKSRILREGRDITLVGWGNTVGHCVEVAETLSGAGFSAEVVDPRTLSPLDTETVRMSAEKTGKLVVVHEDNRSCGLGAELIAAVSEAVRTPVRMVRVTRPDTFVPCNFDNQLQVLPSYRSLLEAAADLLDLSVEWRLEEEEDPSLVFVKALALSPADEFCIVVELAVEAGDEVQEGDVVGTVETNKAVAEVAAPASGLIEEVFVEEGQTVAVGEKILSIRVAVESAVARKSAPRKQRALLSRKSPEIRVEVALQPGAGVAASPNGIPVYLSGVACSLGARSVPNEVLLEKFPEWSSKDVVKRMGIESRRWVAEGETALSLALSASRDLFETLRLGVDRISAIICTTGTPMFASPSIACELLAALGSTGRDQAIQAFDISAACSGYLYGLQIAHDMIQSSPESRVLLVTTEVLSPLLDLEDQSTAFIFGDAATATILSASPLAPGAARLKRPLLSSMGDKTRALTVPLSSKDGCICMKGKDVAREAGKSMASILTRACNRCGLTPADLDLVVPHQANKRITVAVQRLLKLPEDKVFSNIKDIGNTSSSTIPICLHQVLPGMEPGCRIGLVAFGAGYTLGAAILETVDVEPRVNQP